MGFFKKDKGLHCKKNEDGSETCMRYEKRGNDKIATGSEITIVTDPATCKVQVTGDVMSLNDDEINDFDSYARSKEMQCRRGVQG